MLKCLETGRGGRAGRGVVGMMLACVAAAAGVPAMGQVRISQVGMGAGLNGNSSDGNFIELYNAGSTPVSLAGKSLQWASSAAGGGAGGGWTKFNLSGTIAPQSYWLVRATTATGAVGRYPNIYGVPFTADQTYTLGDGSTTSLVVFGKSGGKVVLANTTTLFTTNGCASPDAATILDLVSWANGGTNIGCFEGALGPVVIEGTAPVGAFVYGAPAVARRCGGLTDTNDNQMDFVNAARPPRNSAYPANAESVPSVNAATQVQTLAGEYFVTYELNRYAVRAYQGQTVRFAAYVVACSGTIASVTANLSAVGGPAAQVLYDDGSHGDLTEGDGVYTFDYVLPGPSTAPLSTSANPQYLITYTATDSAARAGQGQSPLVVDPVPPANDLCGNAQVIAAGPLPFNTSVSGTVVSASSGSLNAVPGNGASAVYPFGQVSTPCTTNGGYGGTSRDVWYAFTPQESATYTISTCNSGTNFDSVLMVLDLCPSDDATDISSALACNDEGCTAGIFGGASTIPSVFMSASTGYLIRVAGYGSGVGVLGGAYTLTIVSGSYGACCSPSGICTQGAQSDCTGSSVYQGDNTTCETFLLCTGACCHADGTCTITGPGNCNGDFASLGIGVPCQPINFCPQPATEMCCRGTTCNSVTARTCTGVFSGSASIVVGACTGTTLAGCCYADFNHDGNASIDDLFLYLNAYFSSSPWSNVGGDGVAAPTIDDLFLYINAYFTGCA